MTEIWIKLFEPLILREKDKMKHYSRNWYFKCKNQPKTAEKQGFFIYYAGYSRNWYFALFGSKLLSLQA